MKLLIALVIWIAALAGAAELSSTVAAKYPSAGSSTVSAGSSTVSAGSSTVSAGSNATSTGTAAFDPSSVKSADGLSLLRTANLAKALKIARAHLPRDASLSEATIYPGYLVLIFDTGGSAREVAIEANGAYSGSTPAGSSGRAHFPLKQLSAGVPSKLAKEIEASAHVAESRLGYMVLSANSGSGPRWQIYPVKSGAVLYYDASVTGRGLVAWTASGPRPLR